MMSFQESLYWLNYGAHESTIRFSEKVQLGRTILLKHSAQHLSFSFAAQIAVYSAGTLKESRLKLLISIIYSRREF